MSTESGIPDFRSPGGIWETFRIVNFHEFLTSEKARLEDWRRRFYMEDQLANTKPNIGHRVLADWVNSSKCSKIITQNIDGLHQMAGTPGNVMIEIHGSAHHANCLRCGLRYEMAACRKMHVNDRLNLTRVLHLKLSHCQSRSKIGPVGLIVSSPMEREALQIASRSRGRWPHANSWHLELWGGGFCRLAVLQTEAFSVHFQDIHIVCVAIQNRTGFAQGHKAQFIDDQQVLTDQLLLHPLQAALIGGFDQFVNEGGGGRETHFPALLTGGQALLTGGQVLPVPLGPAP